jgi:FtsP/CotA-like multicopper oxidase with cupredoxin domain
MDRRTFMGVLAAGGTAGALAGCRTDVLGAGGGAAAQLPLRIPPVVPVENVVLTAQHGAALVAPGVTTPVWTLGESAAWGATLLARRGARMRVALHNQLTEPTIVHWHGLRPPEAADGHPRLAVAPGSSYEYDFTVDEPAALYWYHPHAHMRTAIQTYMGMAGLLVVRDEVEESLGLPAGARELVLAIQDKRLGAGSEITYNPAGPDMMEGFLGDVAFVNGVRFPFLDVVPGLYRLRVLNGANARIFRLAMSDGRPFTVIGGDAGFLAQPATLDWLDLAPGERTDLLLDLTGVPAGRELRLRSAAFQLSGGMGMGMGMARSGQGTAMDLLTLRVGGEPDDASMEPPAALPGLAAPARSSAARQRTFRFASMMMNHTINGRGFAMDRVDEVVPFGATEIWTFINDSPFPHPVHMHAVHFHVLSRTGGRGRVMPWETGPKDTVLVLPGESVDVIARFDAHPGLFLLHCHNLEHEDMGMMMNFAIDDA